MDMKFPKINIESLLEELDVKWTIIILAFLFLTYIVGKTFLQLFTSLYGWIIVGLAIAILVSPELNLYMKDKINLYILKFRSMSTPSFPNQ